MSKYQVLYFDDSPSELQKFRTLLAKTGHLDILPLRPPSNLALEGTVKDTPDMVLIDYVLWKGSGKVDMVSYQGGTLATRVRETWPECPIVLISRRNRFRKFGEAQGQLGSVDYVVFKDDFESDLDLSIHRLVSICQGFESLRRTRNRDWKAIVGLLRADEFESSSLKAILPSVQSRPGAKHKVKWTWSVPEVARWILQVIFKYPGILYDSLHAATSLGISQESFSEISTTFSKAKYTGVFCTLAERWWRGRLLKTGLDHIHKAKLDLPVAQSFAPAFKKLHDKRVYPARCVVTGKEYADTVCYILEKPVLREKTLEYYPDDRPRLMEPARVSFKAVVESAAIRDELFTDEGRRLVKLIRKGVYK